MRRGGKRAFGRNKKSLQARIAEANIGDKAFSVSTLRRLYDQMNVNEDGYIDEEVLFRLLLKCGMSDIEAETYAGDFFRNRLESTFQDFCEEWIRMNNFKVVKLITEEFHRIDKNKDGVLSREELYRYFITHHDGDIARQQINDLFESVDVDESGGVSTHELRLWYRNTVKRAMGKKKSAGPRTPTRRGTSRRSPALERRTSAFGTTVRRSRGLQSRGPRPSTDKKRGSFYALGINDKVERAEKKNKDDNESGGEKKGKLDMTVLKESFDTMQRSAGSSNLGGRGHRVSKDDMNYMNAFELKGLLVLSGMKSELAQGIIDNIMELLDTKQAKGSGATARERAALRVHFQDFCRELVTTQLNQTLYEVRDQYMRRKGNSKTISTKHMARMIREVHKLHVSDVELKTIMARLDTDGDGDVSFLEFEVWFKRMMQRGSRRQSSLQIRTKFCKSAFRDGWNSTPGPCIVFGQRVEFVREVKPDQCLVLAKTEWIHWGCIAFDKPHGQQYPPVYRSDGKVATIATKIEAYQLYALATRDDKDAAARATRTFAWFVKYCAFVPATQIVGLVGIDRHDLQATATSVIKWNKKRVRLPRALVRKRATAGPDGLSTAGRRTVQSVVNSIVDTHRRKIEQITTVLLWIKQNIALNVATEEDDDAKATPVPEDDADAIITSGRATPAGYSLVVEECMEKLNVPCMTIAGKARFPGSTQGAVSDYRWNAVLCMNQGMVRWNLVDVCFDVINSRNHRQLTSSAGCFQHPAQFALLHFPERVAVMPEGVSRAHLKPFLDDPGSLQMLTTPIPRNDFDKFAEINMTPLPNFYEFGLVTQFNDEKLKSHGRAEIKVYCQSKVYLTCSIKGTDSFGDSKLRSIDRWCWKSELEVGDVSGVQARSIKLVFPHHGQYKVEVSVRTTANPSLALPVFSLECSVTKGHSHVLSESKVGGAWLHGFMQHYVPTRKTSDSRVQRVLKGVRIEEGNDGQFPFASLFTLNVTAPKKVTGIRFLTNGYWQDLARRSNTADGRKLFVSRVQISDYPDARLYAEVQGKYYLVAEYRPESWDMTAQVKERVELDSYGNALKAGVRVDKLTRLGSGTELHVSLKNGYDVSIEGFEDADENVAKANYESFKVEEVRGGRDESGGRTHFVIDLSMNVGKKYMVRLYISEKEKGTAHTSVAKPAKKHVLTLWR